MRRRIIIVAVAVILATPLVILALLATEPGSRWVLGMASRAAGDGFSYASVEGDLLSELRLSGLEVRAAGHQTRASDFVLRWRPLALLSGRLHVQRLVVTQLEYTAPKEKKPAPADEDLEGVSFPIAIRVDDVRIEDVLIRRDKAENRIDRALLQGFTVDGNVVTLARLEVAADTLELTAHGQVDPSPPHAVEAGIVWSLQLPDGATAEGAGNLTGTLEAIRIEHALKRPFSADLSGTIAPLEEPLRLDLSGQWRALRWPFEGTPEFESRSGTFTARGNLRQLALTLEASLDSDKIPARSLRLDADLKRPGKQLEASLRWSTRLANGEEASGSGTFTGNARRINIDHTLETPVRISTQGHVSPAGKATELSLRGEWRDLSWPLMGEPTISSASGRYQLSGVPDALGVRINAALRSPTAQIDQGDLELQGNASAVAPFPFDLNLGFKAKLPQNVAASGRATFKGDAKKIEIDSSLEQPVALESRGAIILTGKSPTLDFSGEWRDLRWPLEGEADFRSASGNFSASGPLDQLALKVNAKASGRRLPPADTRVDAQLGPQSARIRSLSIDTLGGEIRAAGDVGWQPAPRWTLEVSATGLKPERFFEQWPGEIALQTTVSGRVDAGTPKLNLERLKLDGRLRGYPVNGSGALSIDGTMIKARDLRLRSGDNRIEVNGDAGDRLDLSFAINAPALNAVAPKLQGRLEGEGRLRGKRAEPTLVARLSGGDLAWENRSVKTLALNVDAGTAPGYRSRISLDAGGIRLDGGTPGELKLSGDGTPEQHRLVLDFSSGADSLVTTAKGRYRELGWSGTLESELKSKDFGQWRTLEPVSVSASADRISLDRLCLTQASARLCAGGRWEPVSDAIEASGEVASLPLVLAQPFLPEGVRLEGSLSGEFKVTGTRDAPQANGSISAKSGKLFYEPGAGFESAEFDYRDGRIDVSHAPSGTRLQAALDLKNAGSVNGNFQIGPLQDDTAASLKGQLKADFSDVGWIGVMVPGLVDVRGRLNSALDIGGTTANPAISGELLLEKGEGKVPDLGLELNQINLALSSDRSGRVSVEGALSSGGGKLDINGRSNLSPGERRLELEIKGSEFEVARLPTVQAYVSPDLRLSADPKLAELTGSVHIPRAKVKLKELPVTAVKVSEDEVIVNAEQGVQTQRKRPGPTLRIKVDVSLGDEVSFDGFGLTTHIEGNLAVSGETGKPPEAQGTLSLREGRYEAYGQDLKIRTGRLLFAGPINNPGVDLTAVRELKDVTAGIVVGGSVKSVDSRVFSEPPMPEADAFSYLLTGRPLSGGSETDAAKLQQAAAALGLKRANVITQQIQTKVGLDELTVGGDGVDQTSLLLGKQIAPDIFIRYALGIFEQSGKLILDYRLTDSVSVQAESGEQQGMDIIYKIEREKLF